MNKKVPLLLGRQPHTQSAWEPWLIEEYQVLAFRRKVMLGVGRGRGPYKRMLLALDRNSAHIWKWQQWEVGTQPFPSPGRS